jgi:hypothetical protein
MRGAHRCPLSNVAIGTFQRRFSGKKRDVQGPSWNSAQDAIFSRVSGGEQWKLRRGISATELNYAPIRHRLPFIRRKEASARNSPRSRES